MHEAGWEPSFLSQAGGIVAFCLLVWLTTIVWEKITGKKPDNYGYEPYKGEEDEGPSGTE